MFVQVELPLRSIDADPAGGAAHRGRAAIGHVVAQQVVAGAGAGEIVNPEPAPGQTRRPDDGQDIGDRMAEQAVDRQAVTSRRDIGQAVLEALGQDGGTEDPGRNPVPDHAQQSGLAGTAQHRPGVDRVEVQMVAAGFSGRGGLALEAELHPAQIGRIVVVTEGQMQVDQA